MNNTITKKYAWNNNMQTLTTIFKQNSISLTKIDVTYQDKLIYYLDLGCRSLEDIHELYYTKEERLSYWYKGDKYLTKSAKNKAIRKDFSQSCYVWNGYEYESINDLVYDTKIPKSVYLDYVARGIVSDEERQIDRYGYAITWNGVKFL